jgi:hypothetical protein
MYIAHSNITPVSQAEPVKQKKQASQFAIKMAKKGFVRSCKKNAGRIAEIQKTFPGWEPKFNYPS